MIKFTIIPFYSLSLINNSIQKACVGAKPDRHQTKLWVRTDCSGKGRRVRPYGGEESDREQGWHMSSIVYKWPVVHTYQCSLLVADSCRYQRPNNGAIDIHTELGKMARHEVLAPIQSEAVLHPEKWPGPSVREQAE